MVYHTSGATSWVLCWWRYSTVHPNLVCWLRISGYRTLYLWSHCPAELVPSYSPSGRTNSVLLPIQSTVLWLCLTRLYHRWYFSLLQLLSVNVEIYLSPILPLGSWPCLCNLEIYVPAFHNSSTFLPSAQMTMEWILPPLWAPCYCYAFAVVGPVSWACRTDDCSRRCLSRQSFLDIDHFPTTSGN